MSSDSGQKRRRLRRLLKLTSLIVGVFLAVSLVGKFWIIPGVFRSRLDKVVSRHWDGALQIAEIRFNYFSPTDIVNVTLRDRAGRIWARIGSARLSLELGASPAVVLRQADIKRLAVEAHLIDGRCRPPVRDVRQLIEWLEERTDIDSLDVSGGSIVVVDDKGPSARWDGLAVACRRKNDKTYTVELTRRDPGTSPLSCGGSLQCRLEAHWPAGKQVVYEGTLSIRDVEWSELLRPLGGKSLSVVGTMQVQYEFHGEGFNVEALGGRGKLALERAEPFWRPGTSWLAALTTIAKLAGNGAWEGRADFSTWGPVVTIDEAQMVSRFVTVQAKPGATIHLANGEVDMQLIAKLTDRSIPLPGQGQQFHLSGHWNAPSGLKVKLIPPWRRARAAAP